MKKIIFCGFLLLFFYSAQAQDLIIKQNGDSVECEITGFRNNFIIYNVKSGGAIYKSAIPRTSVRMYKENYFYTKPFKSVDLTEKKSESKSLRIALSGGPSQMTKKIESSWSPLQQQYTKVLSSGYHINFSSTFFVFRNFGSGLQYSLMRTKNKMENIVFYDESGNQYIGEISDNIFNHYFAAQLYYRMFMPNQKTSLLLGLSLGGLFYSNEQVYYNEYNLSGKTFALSPSLEMDFSLSKHVALGLGISYTNASIKSYEVSPPGFPSYTQVLTDPDDLSRVDFSFGIRF